jgi:hypothetical protein
VRLRERVWCGRFFLPACISFARFFKLNEIDGACLFGLKEWDPATTGKPHQDQRENHYPLSP